jgi:UDP-N-acetylmuramate--alanine ligase
MESHAPVGADLPIAELVRSALARRSSPFRSAPVRWLLVDVDRQRLLLMHGEQPVEDFAVSTAANGVGGESGSYRTPPGWHRIHRRIGAGEPRGAVFVSREPTGAVWQGEPRADDLILTRILTLDGMEEGVNRGPGRDSLERYIYLHGTNHETALGLPTSHGCVRLANADIERLFEAVEEGDPVAIVGGESASDGAAVAEAEVRVGRDAHAAGAAHAPETAIPDPRGPGRFHYAGLAGSGMSALALFQVLTGGRASGSDRAFDRGERDEAREQLENAGITVTAQDGSGIGDDCAALVVSTAVEAEVPDVAAALARGIPVIHRSELLAHFVATHRTIAITGTSGKSTVAGMVFEMLRGAGRDPSVITGGELVSLQREGRCGNAWAGGSDLLVIEADESDGSLVRYQPAVGVVLNLQKDHKEEHEVMEMFRVFRDRAREALVVSDDDNLVPLLDPARARGIAVHVFGETADATVRAEDVDLGRDTGGFDVNGVRFAVTLPGEHNLTNALAAVAACHALGVPLESVVEPLARFQGVARRFQTVGRARGVEVVDDFAHNPAKIRAAIATARRRSRRVLAVYQAHGYAPTRFLRPDLVAAFVDALGPHDRLWMPEVFYAGGTAVRDFSAADLVREIADRGIHAEYADGRDRIVRRIAQEARPGDVVLIMGARDPSLTQLAHDVLTRLSRPDRP